MDPILSTIDDALQRKGISDAAASKLAVGHPSLIKNLRMPRAGEKRYNLPALMKLAEVLDLEFYFGPRRDHGLVEHLLLDGTEYAHIPVHDALLAAGGGVRNAREDIIDTLAFRSEWLKRISVPASAARLARVHGDSMQPTLWPGDLVMINTLSTTPPLRVKDAKDQRRRPIYAIIDDGEARIKRLECLPGDTMVMVSDNPDYAPELRQGRELADLRIIGKVVWWGHTEKDNL